MDLKRAIWTGALLWVLIFFEISILMFGFELKQPAINYAHFVIAIALITIAALLYFRKNKASVKEGLLLGIIYVIVESILDAIITVPLFVKTYAFFIDPMLWIGLAETIIVAGIVGGVKKNLK